MISILITSVEMPLKAVKMVIDTSQGPYVWTQRKLQKFDPRVVLEFPAAEFFSSRDLSVLFVCSIAAHEQPKSLYGAVLGALSLSVSKRPRRNRPSRRLPFNMTNLYGSCDNYHPTNSYVLPALIRRFHEAKEAGKKSVTCWGTGSQMREFLYVDDLVEVCVFALKNWSAFDKNAPKDDQGKLLAFLNVGTGVDLSLRELAEEVARATAFKGDILWDDIKLDGALKKQLKASRLGTLGWLSWIPLAEGLESTVSLFKKPHVEHLVRL